MQSPCRTDKQQRDQRILDLLRRLVRINTEHTAPEPGAPYGKGCAAALDLALAECERRGFAVTRLDQRIGWAEVGKKGPLAAFPVHLDVVPASGGKGWSHGPYAAEVLDGVLFGRGCMDNKAGAAVMIELIDALAQEFGADGRELPCRLRIIFGTDEETGMADMAAYVAAGCEQPTLGFVPDAAFPAVRGEKARLHLVCACESLDGCDDLRFIGGTAANVVPDSARAELPCGRVLEASGRPAHGSTPEKGENAIAKLVAQLVAEGVGGAGLAALDELLCRDLHGAAAGIDVPDKTFGHTSLNLGVLNIEGGRARVELDVRFGLGIDTGEVVSRLGKALGDAWSVEVAMAKPVHLVPEDDPCLQALLAAYRRVTDDAEPSSVMAGGTYASYLPALVAFGPKLPGTHTGAHGIDEHVSLANISRATDVYEEALRAIVALAE